MFAPNQNQMYPDGIFDDGHRDGSERRTLRSLSTRTFRRCGNGRGKTLQSDAGGFRDLRRERLSAAPRRAPDGTRSRYPDNHRRPPNRSRTRRPGNVVPQCALDAGRTPQSAKTVGNIIPCRERNRERTAGSRSLASARLSLADAGFSPLEYLELRAEKDLRPLQVPSEPARLLAAGYLGKVRLIDNVSV